MRWTPLDCHSGEGCLLLVGVKLPDMLEFSLNECVNLKECRAPFTRLQFAMYSKQEGVCFDVHLIITKMHVQYDQIQGSFSGQETAVKRVSHPYQGLEEFKNVVVLIAKLQHRNLVSLLDCCTHGDECMLIYEYMSNKSMDLFIFNDTRSALLGWDTRFNIIMRITRGLLYLHQDSKLQIIHRDLKAGNILSDSYMNPKISDFGLARIFGGNENEAKTKKVVGT